MTDYEDITERYAAYARVDLATLDPKRWDCLIIGDLIRTPDGRILLPEVGPEEANLFAVYAGSPEKTVIVAELPSLTAAEQFLDSAEEQGWHIERWGDILPILAKIAQSQPAWIDDPEGGASLTPWLRNDLLLLEQEKKNDEPAN